MAQFFKCWTRRAYAIGVTPTLIIALFSICKFIYTDPISGFNLMVLIIWTVIVVIGIMLVLFSLRSTTLIIDESWFFLNEKKYEKETISHIMLRNKDIVIRRNNKLEQLTLSKWYFRKEDWNNIKMAFEDFANKNEIRIKKQ